MSRSLLRLFLVLVLIPLLALPAAAKKKPVPTEPGKYTDWRDEIDELEIVQTFDLSSYSKVVVEPFDTSETPLPEKDDNTYEPVQQILKDPAAAFTAGLDEALDVPVSKGPAEGEKGALVVRAKVMVMDPGSRAARYWGGFGAGAARTQLSGELVDAATGTVLARFTQERRSGVGVAGGDYVNLMNRNLRKIGEDVALILDAF